MTSTTPPLQKTEIDPTPPITKSSLKIDPDNDSPTPRKKFGTPNSKGTTMVDTPVKSEQIKQTSLPITPNTGSVKGSTLFEYANSDSMVNRFNPGLATILSKGPPGSSRPVPLKSKSAPEPRTTTEDIEEGKQLTHLTKGRARGPKKRNSGKRAEEKPEGSTSVQRAPTQRPTIQEEPESTPPVPPKEMKRPITREIPVFTPPIQP